MFIAGYTGVLLSVTNRPIWSDTPLLGMLFIMSAASTSVALVLLLAQSAGWRLPAMADLHRLDSRVIVLELLVLVAVIVSLGPVSRVWLSRWGVLLASAVVVGMAMPLAMWWRPGWLRDRSITTPAALVLLGGFLLRVVIVLSSESV